MFSFLVLAIISAKPPKKAINTSLISNDDLDNNSEDSSFIGIIAKNIYAVITLKKTITKKFIKEFLSVSTSFVAIENPNVEMIKPCNLCPYMKKITLQGIYNSLTNGTDEVKLTDAVMDKARLSIKRMIEVK